jgi:hypothetical protein
MSPYQIHGMLQGIVFLILYPLGALIALLRNQIGPSWRPYHVGIQLTASILFFIAISIVAYASYGKPKKESNIRTIHRWNGRLIALLIITQLFWAYQGRNYVEWMTWYYVHMSLSASIILLGWTNIYLARMILKK